MGFLSSLFGKNQKPTTSKYRVSGLLASSVDYVLSEIGPAGLIRGSFVLDTQMRPSFRSGTVSIGGDVAAAVAVRTLDEANIFEVIAESGRNVEVPDHLVDQLVYAAVRKFEEQSSTFRSLPTS